MRLRFGFEVLVFISAYSPLAVIFLIQDLNTSGKTIAWDHPWFTFGYLVISVLCCIALMCVMNMASKGSPPPSTLTMVTKKSGELVNYSIPYMISFFVVDLSNWKVIASFVFFMLLMYVVAHRTHNVFVNPVLAIFGYNLYEVRYVKGNEEKEALVLSRKPLFLNVPIQMTTDKIIVFLT